MDFKNLIADLQNHECPKCHTKGNMFIATISFSVSCRNCKGAFLDPYEVGPWDLYTSIAEKDAEGNEVFYFVPNDKEETEDNTNLMEFMKYFYEKKGSALS